MDVDFTNEDLRKRAQRQVEAERAWGGSVGRKYVEAVNFLANAETIQDVRQVRGYRYKKLHEPRWLGCFEMRLNDQYRLIIRPPEGSTPLMIVEVWDHGK